MQIYTHKTWTFERFEVCIAFDMSDWGLSIAKDDFGDGDMLRYVKLGPLSFGVITLGQPANAETQRTA